MEANHLKPTIAILTGDRNGIGPEIAVKLLADDETAGLDANLVLVAHPDVLDQGRQHADETLNVRVIETLEEVADDNASSAIAFLPRSNCPDHEPIATSEVSEAAGAEVLDQLGFLLDASREGRIDGIVHPPFNKPAMKQAGLKADVIDFVMDRIDFDGLGGEFSVLGNLWTSRVTSHMALKDVPGFISEDRIVDMIRLTDATLKGAGIKRPRLAVAGLNPHAGDGGVLGDEEIRIIGPAVDRAAREQIDVRGPLPADSVFVAAKDGAFDAVIAMYHDQSQLALKLLGFGHGVTLFGGLPVPVTTVMHGTAYDIVGQGIADATGMKNALRLCRRVAGGAS